ncbi:MAG TPA: fasciclin domain-containing protein [Candidatus Limnocylindrales bacterium]|nr:fasciclin domain-containing protein [Candidatus Limnocylindrales bacterium]
MRRIVPALLAGALATGLVAGPVLAKQPDPSGSTIVDIAVSLAGDLANPNDGEFETLVAAVLEADAAGLLSARGKLTVFAPTDAAFAEIGVTPANVGTLDDAFLLDVLLFHVARGERWSGDVVASDQIRMLNGDVAEVNIPYIANAQLELSMLDIAASNGVIHVVNDVLLPPAD